MRAGSIKKVAVVEAVLHFKVEDDTYATFFDVGRTRVHAAVNASLVLRGNVLASCPAIPATNRKVLPIVRGVSRVCRTTSGNIIL